MNTELIKAHRNVNCLLTFAPLKYKNMNLTKIVAISSLPGLYKIVANKSNGLIVESLDDSKRRFVSARRYNFTPLESISIYTMIDSVELEKVFRNMLDQLEDNPVPDLTETADVLREYFLDILPDHDQDRVHVGDIKKVIKWFKALEGYGLLSDEAEITEETATESEEIDETNDDSEAEKEEKPATE